MLGTARGTRAMQGSPKQGKGRNADTPGSPQGRMSDKPGSPGGQRTASPSTKTAIIERPTRILPPLSARYQVSFPDALHAAQD